MNASNVTIQRAHEIGKGLIEEGRELKSGACIFLYEAILNGIAEERYIQLLKSFLLPAPLKMPWGIIVKP